MSGTSPPTRKSSIRSWNCPCMSPHIYALLLSCTTPPKKFKSRTVTGAVTVTTLPSSTRSSRALWQSSRTCASGIGRHARSCAIALEMSCQQRSVGGHQGANKLIEVAHDGGLMRPAKRCVALIVACVPRSLWMPRTMYEPVEVSMVNRISWYNVVSNAQIVVSHTLPIPVMVDRRVLRPKSCTSRKISEAKDVGT